LIDIIRRIRFDNKWAIRITLPTDKPTLFPNHIVSSSVYDIEISYCIIPTK